MAPPRRDKTPARRPNSRELLTRLRPVTRESASRDGEGKGTGKAKKKSSRVSTQPFPKGIRSREFSTTGLLPDGSGQRQLNLLKPVYPSGFMRKGLRPLSEESKERTNIMSEMSATVRAEEREGYAQLRALAALGQGVHAGDGSIDFEGSFNNGSFVNGLSGSMNNFSAHEKSYPSAAAAYGSFIKCFAGLNTDDINDRLQSSNGNYNGYEAQINTLMENYQRALEEKKKEEKANKGGFSSAAKMKESRSNPSLYAHQTQYNFYNEGKLQSSLEAAEDLAFGDPTMRRNKSMPNYILARSNSGLTNGNMHNEQLLGELSPEQQEQIGNMVSANADNQALSSPPKILGEESSSNAAAAIATSIITNSATSPTAADQRAAAYSAPVFAPPAPPEYDSTRSERSDSVGKEFINAIFGNPGPRSSPAPEAVPRKRFSSPKDKSAKINNAASFLADMLNEGNRGDKNDSTFALVSTPLTGRLSGKGRRRGSFERGSFESCRLSISPSEANEFDQVLLYVFSQEQLNKYSKNEKNIEEHASEATVFNVAPGTTFSDLQATLNAGRNTANNSRNNTRKTSVLAASSSGNSLPSQLQIKFYDYENSVWKRMKDDVDWRDAFNASRLDNRKLIIAVKTSAFVSREGRDGLIAKHVMPVFPETPQSLPIASLDRERQGELAMQLQVQHWDDAVQENRSLSKSGLNMMQSRSELFSTAGIGFDSGLVSDFEKPVVKTLLGTLLGSQPKNKKKSEEDSNAKVKIMAKSLEKKLSKKKIKHAKTLIVKNEFGDSLNRYHFDQLFSPYDDGSPQSFS
jgi:hypothetical protein